MNFGQYRFLFIAGILVLILIITVPALGVFIHLPSGSESFSELWLLDSQHRTEAFPYNVTVNESYSVYVGVGNHLGYTAYYQVLVKFRNQTQPRPVASTATPSSLPSLYTFGFLLEDGKTWEDTVQFRFLGVTRRGDVLIVRDFSVNDVTVRADSLSNRNVERNEFFYQLFFELWLYNSTLHGFQYHNRYVYLGLNMTG